MDRRFVTTLALRLLGLFVLLQALLPLGYMVAALPQALSGEGFGLEYAMGSLLSLLVLLGFGTALLLVAPALAARWVGGDGPEHADGGMEPRALEQIGYRLLGIYAVVTNAPSLLGQVGAHIGLASATGTDFLTRDTLTTLVGTAIGLWLLLGARGLAGLVDRVRGAGLQESEQAWKADRT